MARDKTDKTPAATLATTATQKVEEESLKLVGLLGGERDLSERWADHVTGGAGRVVKLAEAV